MTKSNQKKKKQLGLDLGTAAGRLKKKIMYHLTKRLDEHYCFQCGEEIESVEDFTIEHKIPWLDSNEPGKLFFDLDNIAFSHSSCNILAARKPRKRKHPSIGAYQRGCRCEECIKLNYQAQKKWRGK